MKTGRTSCGCTAKNDALTYQQIWKQNIKRTRKYKAMSGLILSSIPQGFTQLGGGVGRGGVYGNGEAIEEE